MYASLFKIVPLLCNEIGLCKSDRYWYSAKENTISVTDILNNWFTFIHESREWDIYWYYKMSNWINTTACLDLSPFQNTWEAEPVITDTQFSATGNPFQTNNTVRRFIVVIGKSLRSFCMPSAFLQLRHCLSFCEVSVSKRRPFSSSKMAGHLWDKIGFSLVYVEAKIWANQNCRLMVMWEPGTRQLCWYYPLALWIAVIRRKHFIENMADVGGMIAVSGIESPNKRAKMDSGLTATNFDESKFARYYRTDAASSPTSSHSSPVGSDSSAFYSYPYSFPSNSFSSYAYPCGQTDATALYTYPASYGVHYNTLNGFSSEYSTTTGMHICA